VSRSVATGKIGPLSLGPVPALTVVVTVLVAPSITVTLLLALLAT
jgi:hypothetical protein